MLLLRYILIFLLASMSILGSVFIFFSQNLPKIETITEIKLTNPMRIYSADNKLLGLFGSEKRRIVEYKEIPENLKLAILAAEDNDFFEHSGIKLTSLLRATYGELFGLSLGGGGTITMQVVRNYVLSFERTYERKIKEIILALRLEDILTKEKIFELYFNKAFLGNRNYGFAAAYQYYFGKDFSEASISEAALLAAILQRPSTVNPVRSPLQAERRRDLVLRRMLSNDYISNEEYENSLTVNVTSKSFGPEIEVSAQHFSEQVRLDVINRFGLGAYEDGLNVYTTLDSEMQSNAVKSVTNNLINYQKRYGWKTETIYKILDFESIKNHHQKLINDDQGFDNKSLMNNAMKDAEDFLSGLAKLNEELPSIVIDLSDKEILTLDQSLNFKRILWSENFSWARKENIGSNAKAEGFTDFLEKGSLIYLKQNGEETEIFQSPSAEAAFVAVNSKSGNLLSYVGGFDFNESKFDRVKNSTLQPGSNLKPFIYACAFENRFNPSSVLIDGPIAIADENLESVWRPKNNSGKFYGPTRLREALVQSLNMISIKLAQSLGIERIQKCFNNYRLNRELFVANLSVALGSGQTNPFFTAQNFSLFANNGKYVELFYIDRIENLEGKIVFDPKQKYSQKYGSHDAVSFPWLSNENFDYSGRAMIKIGNDPDSQVLDERVAFIVNDILKEALLRNAKQRNLSLPFSEMGGKTGTTNDSVSTWFSGYAEDIVATAWVGKDNGDSLGANEYGSTTALPIWLDFMNLSKEKIQKTDYVMPEKIAVVRINKTNGLVSNTFDNSIFEFFLEENLEDLLAQ